jgi:hypothetical protein
MRQTAGRAQDTGGNGCEDYFSGGGIAANSG